MPKRYNVNKHTTLSVMLLDLRRHLASCDQCHAAIKARSPDFMCSVSVHSILDIAIRWENNIPGRLDAIRNKDGLVFACPDPNAHGPAYAITAEAITVTYLQDGLF